MLFLTQGILPSKQWSINKKLFLLFVLFFLIKECLIVVHFRYKKVYFFLPSSLQSASSFLSDLPWTTMSMKSLSGATITSWFLDFILKNINSLFSSRSRTVDRALAASWGMLIAIFSPRPFWSPSYVLLMTLPSLFTMTIP